ncbi:hypothetical protein BV20DRAFT_1123159 [Pilatotrama ljubarskyi]|nr:hypothetical protein BV20DRAFT_1123159 [Pilatotrama ljubarskyi]
MDRAALQKLKRTDVQKLAKRDGVKANGKTAQMIEDLLQKHHPLLVPYMDSIPPTSEQEVISRKILRRQGMTLPVPESESASVRGNPRRATGNVEPVMASNRMPNAASAGPVPAPNDESEAQVDQALSPKARNTPGSDKTFNPSHKTTSARDGPSHARAPVANSPSNRPQAAVTTTVAPPCEQIGPSSEIRSAGNGGNQDQQEAQNNPQRNSTHVQRSLGVFSLRPASPSRKTQCAEGSREPVRPPRVFFPPTEAQLAEMQAKTGQGSMAAEHLPLGYAPVFTRPAPMEDQQEAQTQPTDGQAMPKPMVSGGQDPQVLHAGANASADEMPPSPEGPALHLPTISELRDALQEIAPLADGDQDVKEGLRELGILVNVVEQRSEKVKQRVREAQKLRLALEQCFFGRLKVDPRLTNGTWTRLEHVGNATDEEELEEVEELTSREVLYSDIVDGTERATEEGDAMR